MKCPECSTEIDNEVIKDYEAALVHVIRCEDGPITAAANALNKHNPELMSELIMESQAMEQEHNKDTSIH